MPVQYTKVVDDLFDSITKHSIELQRLSNYVQKDLAKEYLKLSNELDGIVAGHDFSKVTSAKARKVMLANTLKRGRAAIHKSNLALAKVVRSNLIDIGNLEAEFSVGSINKAVTGKGTIKFATGKLGVKSISKMADNLIIQGAPQADLWARHGLNLQNKFKDIIRDGWTQQQDIPTIAQRIRGTAAANYKDGIMNVSKHQANSLARTSIASVANQVREETYLANSDVIEGVQFIAVLDNNTTPICRAHSGDKWKMTQGGWLNVQGGHDYRQPPLHFNCRSTMVPMMYPPGEIPAAKRALVPKKKAATLGKPLGIKVCKSPCKYIDADAWLKTQGVGYQKDVLGKAFTGWQAGRLSFKRMVTQKGRLRNTDELAKIYASQDLIPTQIQALKTTDKFKPYSGASKEFKDELAKTEKGAFLKMEERLMTGQQVSRAESDRFGRILRNADPEDLEYKNSYKPENFNDLLGNRAKRLAFYNHTAKRFERISKLHKGDLAKRKTGRLSDIDQRVLDELKDKVVADTAISATNKKILLEMFDESHRIVGSQRSLPMMESLFTLARKTDFSDIDDFVAYLNNATGNAVNSYFSRVKRLEIRLTASTEKEIRFNTLSDNAKTVRIAEINRADSVLSKSVKLAEANKVKADIAKIGKRNMRYFEGTPTHLSVDMELSMENNIQLFLRYLQKDVRMSSKEAHLWMTRMRSDKYIAEKLIRDTRTAAEKLHAKRVQFVLKRTQPGDNILLNDKIMNSPLFKDWLDNAWTGRGFPPKIRKEVGLVLQDAQIYQDLKAYMVGKKIRKYKSMDQSLDEVIDIAPKFVRVEGRGGLLQDISFLSSRSIADAKKVAAARAKAAEAKLNKEGFFARLGRKDAKKTKKEKAVTKKDELRARWEDLSDAKYVGDIRDEIDDLVLKSVRDAKSPFYAEANAILGDDAVRISQMINKELYSSVEKGKQYINTAQDLGDRYFWKFKNRIDVDPEESIRMGHFLIEAAMKAKIVKRTKVVQRVSRDGFPPRDELSWRLVEVDKSWKEAFLANKRNYDIDGLPSIGKAPEIGRDGLYVESGKPTIRGTNKEWIKKEAAKMSSKPWVDNLKYESGTGIRVNGFIYDVMTELEKRGKSIIPRKALNKTDVVARSKRDSYTRARTTAKGLRDDKFFNRMSNDKYGRTYADTTALQWQGDDINKALMMFDKGVALGKHGFDDFSRHFMNVAGFDKIPMQSRIRLFKKIDDDLIIKTVKDPIKYDWWYNETNWIESGVFKNLKGIDSRDIADIVKLAEKADPSGEGAFQLLALMKERAAMLKWVKDGNKLDDFVSHLQSAADGTTNVLQHFAGISRDKSIAKAVNMTKQRGVADAYIQLRNSMDDIGRAMDPSNPLKKYIDIPGLTHAKRRKSVKKGLMTSQYNAGARTLGDGYFDALEGVQVNGKYIFREASAADRLAVGRIMLNAAEDAFPEATKVRHLLNNFAEAHEIAGASAIEVKTPMGFPFRQSYKKVETTQIELRTSTGGRVKLNIQKELEEVDYSKQNRAFAPNIIHAMDATHKSLVVNELATKYGIKNFSMIHDSFGSSFGNMSLLQKATRKTFLDMYQGKNFMKFLADNFESQGIKLKRYVRTEKGMKIKDSRGKFLTEDIPTSEINKLGDYDFKDFMELEYFFH